MTRTDTKRVVPLGSFEKTGRVNVSRRPVIRLIVGDALCAIGLSLRFPFHQQVDRLIAQEPFDTAVFLSSGLLGMAFFIPGLLILCMELLYWLKR